MTHFDAMANESITVVKADGSRNGPYKSTFSKNIMRVFDGEVLADDGDFVERELPSGKTELYVIEEITFVRGLHAIPACWKMIVRKDSSLRSRSAITSTTVNITNSHGIQIGDYNVQHVQSVIESLIESIDASEGTPESKKEAKSRLQAFLQHPLVIAVLGPAATILIKAAVG